MSDADLLRLIDHTVLGPTATEEEIIAGCEVALHYPVASYFVPPVWLPVIVARLRDRGVAAGTTCGFPLGRNTTATKTVEAYDAVMAGADEVDMVMNYSALRSGYRDLVEQDVRAVVSACGYAAQRLGRSPIVVKVILETCYLSEKEKRLAVELAVEAGADFVKTSTGLGPGGATREDVVLMRQIAPDQVGVKAAGGIRSVAQCRQLVKAGANRLGTSATQQIAEEIEAAGG